MACRLRAAAERAALASSIQELEQRAMNKHKQAQDLNKAGAYEEAQAAYAEMRALDAKALALTRELGCPSCQPHPGGSEAPPPEVDADEAVRAACYEQLHVPAPWPADETASSEGGPSLAERARASIICCLCADAAATGVQWIYATDVLQQLLHKRQQAAGDGEEAGLEFYEPVQSPFLPEYSTGRNGPYGEQTLLLLRSLAARGGLDCGHYAATYYEAYSSPSFSGGYRNASTTAFLRNYGRGLRPPACGADDQQADCVTRLAPLVAAFAGDARLPALVAATTRVTQNSVAAAWACTGAAVLERLLLGAAPSDAVRAALAELQDGAVPGGRLPIPPQLAGEIAGHLAHVLQLAHEPHAQAVAALGRNCHLPNSFQTPLHAVLHCEWQQQQHQEGRSAASAQRAFVSAVRDCLAEGGCCASRASFAAACLGAWLGPDALPADWLARYEAAASVCADADALVRARAAPAGPGAAA